jgi:hypothetical protein
MAQQKICSTCKNLSSFCISCGGTSESNRKREFGVSICPTCNNQSDHCMTCGGNVRNSKSQEERDEDDSWND